MDLVFATTTMRVELPTGGFGVIQKGTHWPADDPIVQAHPQAFAADPRYGLNFSRQPEGYDAPVEQATAAPGEKRMTGRPTARPKVDEAFDEADALRAELARLGREVDGRWSLRRLREEMEKAAQ